MSHQNSRRFSCAPMPLEVARCLKQHSSSITAPVQGHSVSLQLRTFFPRDLHITAHSNVVKCVEGGPGADEVD